MKSTSRGARALTIAASLTMLMTGLALQPAAARSNGSSLEWVNQPATTGTDETITTVIGDPSATPLKVRFINGSGKFGRIDGLAVHLIIKSGGASGANLTGDTAVTNSNGIAVFHPSIDREGLDYQLVATAADNASLNSGHIANSPKSSTFDIRDGLVTGCQGTCSLSDTNAGTSATVEANADGYLVLNLDANPVSCGDANKSGTVKFDVVTNTIKARATVTITAPVSSSPYDVCFSSPTSTWASKGGGTIGPGGAGILKNCGGNVATNADPCVEDRDVGFAFATIIFSVPPGDPRAAFT